MNRGQAETVSRGRSATVVAAFSSMATSALVTEGLISGSGLVQKQSLSIHNHDE